MDYSISLINGMSLGLEYVAADMDADLPNACIIFDFFILRFIVELAS